jgi:hypothetical protein
MWGIDNRAASKGRAVLEAREMIDEGVSGDSGVVGG